MQNAKLLTFAGLLVATAFAGCAGTTDTSTTTTQPPAPAMPYVLDCAIANWNETCLALASNNPSISKAEIDLAVNPKDSMNVVVASKDRDALASSRNGQPCVWAVAQYTKDGGKHWNTTYVGKKLADRMPGDALYGWQCITDPILAFEPDGTLHYSLQAYAYRPLPGGDPTCASPAGCALPEGGFMYQAISHDGGATFPQILLMHVGDETAIFHDFMRMGVNPVTGTTFTLWDQLTGGVSSQVVMVGVDHAQTQVSRPPVYFPNQISPLGLGAGAVFGVADGSAKGITYAWLAGFNSGGLAVLAKSTDDGMTFGTPKQVFTWTGMDGLEKHGDYTPKYRTGTLVELAADQTTTSAHKGCLYAVWGGKETVDGNATVGPSDIYVRRSCDKGDTWSAPVLVNTLHREDGQWMPRVSVDGQGTVHVVYLSRAYDPDHNLIDAEHAYSMDGGMNWTTERVTSMSFDGNLGIHQDGFPFIGDYIGIGSAGDHTYMGFPDTISGKAEIAVAHSMFQEDRMSVTVAASAGPHL
ncbi:MAG: sialidase family protein [bacterium]